MKSFWNFHIVAGLLIIFTSCKAPDVTKQSIEITQTATSTKTQPTSTIESKKVQEPILLTQYTFPYDLLTINDLYFFDENIGWAVGEMEWYDPLEDKTFCCKAAIFNTTDGGANWEKVEIENISGLLNSIIFINSSTGYIVGQEFKQDRLALILYTNNGGKTWIKINLNQTKGILNDIAFTEDGQLWTAGAGGLNYESLILHSSDGVNWQKNEHPSHINAKITALNFLDSKIAYASGWIGYDDAQPYLIKSIDGGNSWKEIQLPFLSGRLEDVIFINEKVGYMVGDYGVLSTKGSDENWVVKKPSVEWSKWLRKNNDYLFLIGTCVVSESCINLVAVIEGEELSSFENLTFFGETITGVGNFLSNGSFFIVTNTETVGGLNSKYRTAFYRYIWKND